MKNVEVTNKKKKTMNNEFTMRWIPIKERMPELFTDVFITYHDNGNSESGGISIAALQTCGGVWYVGDCIKGEDYEEGLSIITHWCDYQEEIKYPEP